MTKIVRAMDPRILIHPEMPWIRNTALWFPSQVTHLSVYSELAKLRSHEALLMGDFTTYVMNATFVLTRVKKVRTFIIPK